MLKLKIKQELDLVINKSLNSINILNKIYSSNPHGRKLRKREPLQALTDTEQVEDQD